MNNDVIKVQLSCGVDYYKGDKGDKPIKGVDYFTQEDIADIVEQIETGGIDLDGYATKEYVDNAVSGVVVSETDPTVPEWAKQANKPSYTASEVGALPADTQLFSGNYNDLRNKPAIPTVPANVSAFNNDAGYLTEHQSLSGYATKAYVDEAIENIDTSGGITVETDPTVPSWAKQANKPTYTAQEVGALPANTELFSGSYEDLTNKPTIPTVPSNVSAFTNDAGYLTSHQSLSGYATESYVDTAISNIPTGTTYTFTDGLTESNGTVSWDLNNKVKAGSGSNSLILNNRSNYASGQYAVAEGSLTSASGFASHAEGQGTQASGSNQHAEGKRNLEDSHSIFQNIAGNGTSSARSTMFARDWNGNEYLSGNLFVGCNDFTTTANGLTTANAGGSRVATMSDLTADNITYYCIEGEDPETGDPIRSETADTLTATLDSVLSDMETAISNAGGGSSYTAGNGIDIDSNGVISANIRDNTSALWMALLGISKDWTYFSFNTKSFYSSNTVEEFFDALKRGYIVYIGQSVYWNGLGTLLYNAGIRGFFTLKKDGTYTYDTINSNQPNWRPTYRYDYWLCGNILMATSHSAYNDLFGEGLTKSIYYDNTTSGLSASTIKGAIDEVASNLNTRIPSAPTTDGNYVLKVSVSSGTPTYSWVAE